MSGAKILLVDDHLEDRDFLADMLSRKGVQVFVAGGVQHALTLLGHESLDALFVHLRVPDMDSASLLQAALRICPALPMVVVSDEAKLESCIQAVRLGACDYVTKPFTAEMIGAALARALGSCKRRAGPTAVSPPISGVPAPVVGVVEPDEMIVAHSAAMREVSLLVTRIAASDAAVLVRGEPGVGKWLVARSIHRQSRRADGPFVHVECGAIRETELDTRLFGDDQDSPTTGAIHRGLLESGDGGTVFLANVDRLPMWAQLGMCDALNRGCLHNVTGYRAGPLNIRLIASTCRDLEAAVAEERFCGELYYLLNVVFIHVPPLRQQNIKILAERCLAETLAKRASGGDSRRCRFTREAWESLLNYDWPGNWPELAGVVARAVALASTKEIGREAIVFPASRACRASSGTILVPMTGGLREIERAVIEDAIQRCRGNKAAAARALGLHRRTLYRMLGEDAHDVGASELCEQRRPSAHGLKAPK